MRFHCCTDTSFCDKLIAKGTSLFMALSPALTITQRLVYALHELHRPEMAHWILSGGVRLSNKVLFIEATPPWRAEIGNSSTRGFYEKILTLAAMRVGLPVESTWIYPSSGNSPQFNP
jgi:hypothetical protein